MARWIMRCLPRVIRKKPRWLISVDLGHLWRLDSIAYLNFPEHGKQLIDSTMSEAIIKKGRPFKCFVFGAGSVSDSPLLFRNHGYYFYQNGYASYLADTVNASGKVNLASGDGRQHRPRGQPDNGISAISTSTSKSSLQRR